MENIQTKLKSQRYVGFAALLLLLVIINLFFGFRVGTDDNWFKGIHTLYPNLFKFLKWRYSAYSARIIPDGIDYFIFNVPIIIWQLLNSLFIFVGGYLLASIFNTKVTVDKMILGLVGLCLVDFSLIWDSAYWVTGSLNYLWPSVAALFILKPYFARYNGQEQKSSIVYQILMIFSAIYVGLSNEQMLALVLGFILLFEGYNYIVNRKVDFISIPLIIVLLICIVFLLKSPGMEARKAHEISFWTPEFDRYSLNLKVRIWYIWVIRKIAKFYYFIPLILTWLMYITATSKFKQFGFFKVQIWLLPITMISSRNIDFNTIFGFIFQPIRVAIVNQDFWIAILPYIFWSLELFVLSVGIIWSRNNRLMTLFFILSIVAGLAIVSNSPAIFSTGKIYGGSRIFFFIDFYVTIFILDLLRKVENQKIIQILIAIALGNVLVGIFMY